MATPMKPLVQGGGYYPSRVWTPFVKGNGFTTQDGGEEQGVPKTVSGSILHITDALAGDVSALSVAINPVQSLNGYDNPWPAGGEVNLLPPMVDGTYEGNGVKAVVKDGIATLSGTTTSSGNALIIPLSKTWTAPASFYYHLGNSSANASLAPTIEDSSSPGTNTISPSCSPANRIAGAYTNYGGITYNRIRFYLAKNITVSGTYAPMMCLDNTARSYVPYSNICPISGWTEAKIWREATYDPTANPALTIDLDGTIYGGTLDVLTGVLTARPYYASYNGEALVGPWVSSMDKYVAGATPTTGAQVVDLGGTPTTIQLTPAQLPLLAGENYVWCDAGDTTMTYMAEDN